MKEPGRTVTEFDVRTIDGGRVSYSSLWQRRNLLLVALPSADSEARRRYVACLTSHMAELTAHDTACVITSDPIRGLDAPGVLIADKWGEIQHTAAVRSIEELPGTDGLIEWLRWVQYQCPECQGESR